ncbi:hypothetical protein [Janthinobacterium fluminis]|uniref:Phenylacetate-CoA ligase n=1 Tax=Janthinobacterium fluminis TaxID=2987524 RepID=A0ABT5K4N7_9BURK|nr:hypothetical protein [Janthinobacterium fluminis]MDC8759953.1 hypothetical protein [Janthinobacterium fluminis]
MSTAFKRLRGLLRQNEGVDRLLRHNPLYYRPLRALLRSLDTLDRDGRRALSERLTARTLSWAARLPDGLPAGVPLEQRPLLDKATLRDHPERFRTPGLLRVKAATSGTTGIPLRLLRSLRCVASEQAFADDLMARWGTSFGGARLARLRADHVKPPSEAAPPYGVYRGAGRRLLLSSNHLSPATAGWFVDELKSFRPELLFTHPSSAEALARFMREQGVTLNIPLLFSSSEMLQPNARALLASTFNATVIDYYGMAERVALAVAVAPEAYFFNPAYGRVELLPLDDAEAPPGCRAVEIVATGFWNEAMPLVRYRSGDRAIVPGSYTRADLDDVELGLKPVLAIQGRDKEHLISPRGEVLVGLTHAAHGVRGLIRMQVVQRVREAIEVRVVADPRGGPLDRARLLSNLRDFVPQDMHIEICVVDDIERLVSGKTPFVIRQLS